MDQNSWFADLSVGLPPEVERFYRAGDFAAANARIDLLLQQERLPEQAKGALRACREIMRRIPEDYTLTREDAIALLRQDVPDFSEAEFDALVAADRIDWRYIGGVPYYLDRFVEALRLYPDMNARGLAPEPSYGVRDKVIAAMKKYGHLTADITIRAAVAPPPGAAADDVFEVWLPFPADCEQQSGIQLLDAAPGWQLADPDVAQRCIYWRGKAGEGERFVTYRYRIRADYLDMDALIPDEVQPRFFTHEEAPHILFTPWLRALCEQITRDCRGPLAKARAIYDYVTLNTSYRYQPAYACLENISENCAKSGWGDCGVMALLFITLCRIAGVPARWQSGLYVTPRDAGAHDWAQFYIAPYGWLWADCSFGSGAHRVGNEARRRHYFGNLDPLRMVANRGFYAQLTPPDEQMRNDPYDNQTGEANLNGRPLHGDELLRSRSVVAFEYDAAL